MASSASKHQQPMPSLYGGATSAPPPTPSASTHSASDDAAALSRLLLHRLPPPTLSLPARRSSAPATSPPVLSLSADQTPTHDLLSSVSKLGFFQLTHHSVSPGLAHSAESESLSLFDLSRDQKESMFPKNWPLGYECNDDDDDDDDGLGESFRLDASCSTESTELSLASLREFARALQKLGLEIIDLLSKAMGFENPVGDDSTRFCSLMWISEYVASTKPVLSGGFYPFIVGLQYQIRCQKYSLLSDSGWVSVLPHVDSVLVTIGDIAQVWSNGKLKKVRGRPVGAVGDGENGSRSITMTLLVTLPTESRVAPILPELAEGEEHKDEGEEEEGMNNGELGEKRVFQSFDFEDYAWRVYHERLLFKDPLDRYRVT